MPSHACMLCAWAQVLFYVKPAIEYASKEASGCRADKLHDVRIPDTLKRIEASAFRFCFRLSRVVIPECVIAIGGSAFECCILLRSLTIPESVTELGNGTFEACSALTSVSIPHSLTEIRPHTFCACCSLTSCCIPESIMKIRAEAFARCRSFDLLDHPQLCEGNRGRNIFETCSSSWRSWPFPTRWRKLDDNLPLPSCFRVQRHHERVADEFDHERKCHECHGNGGAGGLEMVVIPPMYLNFGDDKLIQIAC